MYILSISVIHRRVTLTFPNTSFDLELELPLNRNTQLLSRGSCHHIQIQSSVYYYRLWERLAHPNVTPELRISCYRCWRCWPALLSRWSILITIVGLGRSRR
jgi:hypothetical protein